MQTHERPWGSPSIPTPTSLGSGTAVVALPTRNARSHPSNSRLELTVAGDFVVEWQQAGFRVASEAQKGWQ